MYLQALSVQSPRARTLLPRVLSMLAFDNETGGVTKAMERVWKRVPVWVWLAWLPQLLSGLVRPEAPLMKRILVEIARQYPQVRKRLSTRP